MVPPAGLEPVTLRITNPVLCDPRTRPLARTDRYLPVQLRRHHQPISSEPIPSNYMCAKFAWRTLSVDSEPQALPSDLPTRDLRALPGLSHRAALGELLERFVHHDLNTAILGAVEVPIADGGGHEVRDRHCLACMVAQMIADQPSKLNLITLSPCMRRRRTMRPVASNPATLQLFLPKSIPNTAICIGPFPLPLVAAAYAVNGHRSFRRTGRLKIPGLAVALWGR